jgi:hypothetical protein
VRKGQPWFDHFAYLLQPTAVSSAMATKMLPTSHHGSSLSQMEWADMLLVK